MRELTGGARMNRRGQWMIEGKACLPFDKDIYFSCLVVLMPAKVA